MKKPKKILENERHLLSQVWNFGMPIEKSFEKEPFYNSIVYVGRTFPQVIKNLLKLYTKPGDKVLDPTVGSGTTCYESYKLGRHSVGIDISKFAINNLKKRWNKYPPSSLNDKTPTYSFAVDDARKLTSIKDEKFDLIIVSPPWFKITSFGKSAQSNKTLDRAQTYPKFLEDLSHIFKRSYELLNDDGYLAVISGDNTVGDNRYAISSHTTVLCEEIGFKFHYEFTNVTECFYGKYSLAEMSSSEKNKVIKNSQGFGLVEDILVFKKIGNAPKYFEFTTKDSLEISGNFDLDNVKKRDNEIRDSCEQYESTK